MTKLMKERDDVELHRLQGELKAIDTIITLSGTVRDYAKGLQNGTFKEINNAKPV